MFLRQNLAKETLIAVEKVAEEKAWLDLHQPCHEEAMIPQATASEYPIYN